MEIISDSSMINDPFYNKLFFHKYRAIKKLGEGSFGLIYMAENINTHEKYALKYEDKRTGQNLLEQEAYIMSYLRGSNNYI